MTNVTPTHPTVKSGWRYSCESTELLNLEVAATENTANSGKHIQKLSIANSMSSVLERRFLNFLSGIPGAESLDQLLSGEQYKGERRADFLLFDRRVIVEVKSLEVDTSSKVEGEIATHRHRDDFPVIYGDVDLSKVLAHLPDGKEINNRIFLRTTRSVEAAARSAEDQIENTARLLSLPDSVGVLVLLNQEINIFTPEVVAHRLAMLLRRKNDDGSVRSPIAFSWLIFESHFLEHGPATQTLPLVNLKGPRAKAFPWFDELLTYLQVAWANFNGNPIFLQSGPVNLQARSSNVPEQPKSGDRITRQKLWELRYGENPYLRPLDDQEVLRRGKAAVVALTPRFLNSGPQTSPEQWEELMIPWSDFLCEARHRGLDLRHLRDD